jgi:predicted RNase H-like HicB family nuclease
MPAHAPDSQLPVGSTAYTVNCRWDDEAGVWYVAESDVPGLATEAETLEQLEQKLAVMIPELLELNLPDAHAARVAFKLVAEKNAFARSA